VDDHRLLVGENALNFNEIVLCSNSQVPCCARRVVGRHQDLGFHVRVFGLAFRESSLSLSTVSVIVCRCCRQFEESRTRSLLTPRSSFGDSELPNEEVKSVPLNSTLLF
jgi:hypothetical protein